MIKHRLFHKGEQIHALLSSHSEPNVLIPIKCTVKDIKFDEVNPQYLVKVDKFYDSILFLKKYFFKMAFSNAFNKRSRNIRLKPKKFNKIGELEDVVCDPQRNFVFVVDSIMTTKFKADMIQLFNKVMDHIVEKNFSKIKEGVTRPFYKGKYKMDTNAEFYKRFRAFIGDKITYDDEEFETYVSKV